MSTATVLYDSVSLHPSPHRRRSRSKSRSRSISQGFDLTSRIGPKVTGHIYHHKTWVRPGLESMYKSPKKESRRRGSYSSTDSKQGRNPLLEAFQPRHSHEEAMDVDEDMETDGVLDADSTTGEFTSGIPSLLARMEPIGDEDTSHDRHEDDSNHGYRLVDRIASGGTKGPWQSHQRSEAVPVTTTPSRKNRQLGRSANGNSDPAADAANHKISTPPMPVSRKSGAFSSPAAITSNCAPKLTPPSSKADNANPNKNRLASVLSTEDGELRPLLSVDRSKDILATLVAQNLARRRENSPNATSSPGPSTTRRKEYTQSEDRSTVVQFLDGEPASNSLCRQFIDVVGRVGEEMEALRKRRLDAEKREYLGNSSNPPKMPPSLVPLSKSLAVNRLSIDKDSQALIDLLYTPSPKTYRDDLPQSDDQRHSVVTIPPDVSLTDTSGSSAETKINTPPTIHISPPTSSADMDVSPTTSRVDGTSPESEDMVTSSPLSHRAERLSTPPVDMDLDSSDDDGNPTALLSKEIAALDSSKTPHSSELTAVADSDHEDGSIESTDESRDSDSEEGQLPDSASSTFTLDMFRPLPEETDEPEAGDIYSALRPFLDVLRTNEESLGYSEITQPPANPASSTKALAAGRKDVPGVWASAQCLPRVGQRPLVFHLADEMGAHWGTRRRGLHNSRLHDESVLEKTSLDLGLGPILVPVVESDENRKRSRKAGKEEESEEPRTEYSHLQVELACVQLKDVETIWDTFAPQFAEFAPQSRGGLKAKPVISDVPNRDCSKLSRIALQTAFVEALSQLEQRWPQPGELLVLVNEDTDLAREMEPIKTDFSPNGKSDGQAVYLGMDFDPSKPIPLAPHIRQGPNTVRIIQLAPLIGCIFIVFARGSRQGGFVADNLSRKEKKRKSLSGNGESMLNLKDEVLTEANPTWIQRAVDVGWLD